MKTVPKDLNANGALTNSCRKKLLNELEILQTVNHVSCVLTKIFLSHHLLVLIHLQYAN